MAPATAQTLDLCWRRHTLDMLHRIVGTRLMPVTASLAIHLAIVGSILLLPSWTASRESVLILELTEAEAPPAPAAPAIKPDPRPLTLAKVAASLRFSSSAHSSDAVS